MSEESYGKKIETIEDFMDEKLKKEWSSGGLISGERPTVIWVDKESDLLPLIKIMAREMYRIKTGGHPKSHHYEVLAEPFRSAVEDLTADKSIFMITSNALKEIFKKRFDENREKLFFSKIEALYAQRGGFVIIENNENIVPMFPIKNPTYKDICISNKFLNIDKNKFAQIILGYDEPPEIDYGEVDKKYYDELEKLATDAKYSIFVKPAENESLLHYALKVFTYKYLREKKKDKIKPREIRVETPVRDDYIPDVLVETCSTVYEIEALYGKGYIIGRNLYEKVEKAKDHGIKTINFVFSPLHYFILGKQIEKYLKETSKAIDGVDIHIDIPMFNKETFKTFAVKTN